MSIFPRTMRPRKFERATDEDSFLAQRQGLHDFCADSVKPLLTLLSEIGAPPLYVAQTTPFVLAKLTPMQVYAIKSNDTIDVIDVFHETVAQYDGDIFTSSKISGLAPLQNVASGWDQVVATIEKGRVRHGPNSPAEPYNLLWQSGATLGASINRDNSCADFDDHAAWVTGFVSAAPSVAGLSALVHELSQEIKWTPIAMKALLLATSIHPVSGDQPPDFSDQKVGGNYTADLRVGAGGIFGKAIRDVLDGTSGSVQSFDTVDQFWSTSSAGGWRSLQKSQPTFVPVIQTSKRFVRVAVSWYADSPCRMCLATVAPGHNDETWFGEYWGLPTDIDIEVSDAKGQVVSRSISFDNNYEIVQFDTTNLPQPLRINIKAFEGGRIKNETIAVAWSAWD